jgi:hypothetical protein
MHDADQLITGHRIFVLESHLHVTRDAKRQLNDEILCSGGYDGGRLQALEVEQIQVVSRSGHDGLLRFAQVLLDNRTRLSRTLP